MPPIAACAMKLMRRQRPTNAIGAKDVEAGAEALQKTIHIFPAQYTDRALKLGVGPKKELALVANNLLPSNGDMDTEQLLLGHDSADVTMQYIECDERILRQAFVDVI